MSRLRTVLNELNRVLGTTRHISRCGSVVGAFPGRSLSLRSFGVSTRLCRKWAVAPSLRMKDVQHADGGSGSDDDDRCQIEKKAE
jgi:hypothetical protein